MTRTGKLVDLSEKEKKGEKTLEAKTSLTWMCLAYRLNEKMESVAV